MLSVILICKNEEQHIEACLHSVSFADEIVVVDSGSTDGTVSICKQFTDKIYHQQWLGMNGQKQWALSKTTGDWIFNIDADERVTDLLAQQIQQVVSTSSPFDGYLVPRVAFFMGKLLRHGGWMPDLKLRLFKKKKGKWTGTDPHDVVSVEGKVGRLTGEMIHYSFKDLADFWECNNRYATIAAQEMIKRGRKVRAFSVLSHSLVAFMKSYILKAGFLEGSRGLIQAFMIASGVAFKYARAWEMAHLVDEDSTSDLA